MLALLRTVKNGLTRLLEGIVIVAVAALVLDVLWGVCSRFVLRAPSPWTEEVATMLLIWVSLLGAAVAFARREHLGVDYVIRQLDPAARRLLAIVVQLLVIAFAAAVMVRGGYVLVAETLQAGQVYSALNVRVGYIYLAVPVSGAFIIMFCAERILELAAAGDGPGE